MLLAALASLGAHALIHVQSSPRIICAPPLFSLLLKVSYDASSSCEVYQPVRPQTFETIVQATTYEMNCLQTSHYCFRLHLRLTRTRTVSPRSAGRQTGLYPGDSWTCFSLHVCSRSRRFGLCSGMGRQFAEAPGTGQ